MIQLLMQNQVVEGINKWLLNDSQRTKADTFARHTKPTIAP